MPGDNVLRFRNPYDAYEHCRIAIDAWHPLWQAALRSGDLTSLKQLEERFRNRVLAVFPKNAYRGSWASTNCNFAYRLSELSEFEHPIKNMSEARALYQAALPHAAPEWHGSLRATHEHCCAELLLRYAEVHGDQGALVDTARLCEQAIERDTSVTPRALVTLGATHRRLAEYHRSLASCETALDTLRQAEIRQTPQDGNLSWALQRQTLAAVLLLAHELGGNTSLSEAHAAIDEALSTYDLNAHNLWIRPSHREDSIRTKLQIEQGIHP